MRRVGGRVDARAAAKRLPRRARAGTRLARLAPGAGVAATAAVRPVALGARARRAAKVGGRGGGALASSALADLGACAGVCARAAIVHVRSEGRTRPAADRFAGGTRARASVHAPVALGAERRRARAGRATASATGGQRQARPATRARIGAIGVGRETAVSAVATVAGQPRDAHVRELGAIVGARAARVNVRERTAASVDPRARLEARTGFASTAIASYAPGFDGRVRGTRIVRRAGVAFWDRGGVAVRDCGVVIDAVLFVAQDQIATADRKRECEQQSEDVQSAKPPPHARETCPRGTSKSTDHRIHLKCRCAAPTYEPAGGCRQDDQIDDTPDCTPIGLSLRSRIIRNCIIRDATVARRGPSGV